MPELYPLRFEAIYRHYLWGGRRLADLLGKSLPPDQCVAESWEVVDHETDQSTVAFGPLVGSSLGELMSEQRFDLLGKSSRLHRLERFPLLFKFLDANRKLSVQVHPNDTQASALEPPDLGKTEAWLILSAEPGSCLYAGLKDGITRDQFSNALDRGAVEDCLHRIEPRVGDCVFIPAGTVHALGDGLLVAEIQQSSDTTYRLFDWNRVDQDGRPRDLHIEQGLAVTDFQRGPIQARPHDRHASAETLVECDKFVLRRQVVNSSRADIGGDGRCHIVVVIDGEVEADGDPALRPLTQGETMLLPACVGATSVAANHGHAEILDIFIP